MPQYLCIWVALWTGSVHAQEASTATATAPSTTSPATSDPATSRYLYAPSAIPLGKGRWYFSQKELFFSGIATGLTKHISVLAGSIVPALFYSAFNGDPDGLNAVVAVRGSAQVGDKLWVGGGAEVLGVLSGVFGIPFVNATYGQPDHHITLGTGAGLTAPNGGLGFFPVVLAAEHRLSEVGALITENWLILPLSDESVDPIFITSAGWRFIVGRLTADVAMITIIDESAFPLPWLDIAYHWGSKQK
jgi:hypothetical protein